MSLSKNSTNLLGMWHTPVTPRRLLVQTNQTTYKNSLRQKKENEEEIPSTQNMSSLSQIF